jgi:predicted nuclease of predicted toxin-antitoxin system
MIVKLDEALSGSLVDIVASYGYDVRTVRGQGWIGTKDPDLWPLVQAAGEFFITIDKEFGDLRKFPPGSHAGILLLRPQQESLPRYRALVRYVLDCRNLNDLIGATTVATEGRIKTRR